MGFREECDLCGRSIRVVSAKTALNRQDGEIVMCDNCKEKETKLQAFYDKHIARTNKNIVAAVEAARKEAKEEFSRIMMSAKEKRIAAIENSEDVVKL